MKRIEKVIPKIECKSSNEFEFSKTLDIVTKKPLLFQVVEKTSDNEYKL